MQHLESHITNSSLETCIYDVPDNQVVYHALCISCKPNRTLYFYHGTHRAPYGILMFFVRYIYICTNLLIESVFYFSNAFVVADEFAYLGGKKSQKTVRTRGFVRFISTVHRRETVEE